MKWEVDNIREKMNAIERDKKVMDLRKELFKLRSSNAMGGTLTDSTRIRRIKREIARIKTVQNENAEI
jgi:ribosomal protein L29